MCVWVPVTLSLPLPVLLRSCSGVLGGDGGKSIDAASPANLPLAHLTSPPRRAPTSLPPLHVGRHHQTLIAPGGLDPLQQPSAG